ncbi:MAG: GNAT family N-acetyltransferase [Chloroflexota bacterium]
MDIEISTDPARLDLDMIYRFLSEDSYWAQGVPREMLERSFANSLCFGVYLDGQQIGFARVVSDMARVAYLGDVFILPDFRGRGYGKALVQAILDYPDLRTLSRFMLFTRDAHTLYEPYGFETATDPKRLMVLQRPLPTDE